MIPEGFDVNSTVETAVKLFTSRTYKINFKTGGIEGFCDGVEAIKQAIYLILNTERYEHLIYSFNYGVEFENLIGKDIIYIRADIKRRIKEALTQDDRITDVENFKINQCPDKDSILINFDVITTLGAIPIQQEARV